MGFFPDAVAAKLAGREVVMTHLAFFDFVDQPMRLWPGSGTLRTNDGNTWDGTGGLGSIDGLEQPIGGNAPKITFKLTGVDSRMVALARSSATLVKGRAATVYLQPFDIFGDPAFPSVPSSKPLDTPYVIATLILDVLTYSRKGPSESTISLSAETRNYARRRVPYSLVCDRDQQLRYPGDLGLSRVGGSGINKSLQTPW